MPLKNLNLIKSNEIRSVDARIEIKRDIYDIYDTPSLQLRVQTLILFDVHQPLSFILTVRAKLAVIHEHSLHINHHVNLWHIFGKSKNTVNQKVDLKPTNQYLWIWCEVFSLYFYNSSRIRGVFPACEQMFQPPKWQQKLS